MLSISLLINPKNLRSHFKLIIFVPTLYFLAKKIAGELLIWTPRWLTTHKLSTTFFKCLIEVKTCQQQCEVGDKSTKKSWLTSNKRSIAAMFSNYYIHSIYKNAYIFMNDWVRHLTYGNVPTALTIWVANWQCVSIRGSKAPTIVPIYYVSCHLCVATSRGKTRKPKIQKAKATLTNDNNNPQFYLIACRLYALTYTKARRVPLLLHINFRIHT